MTTHPYARVTVSFTEAATGRTKEKSIEVRQKIGSDDESLTHDALYIVRGWRGVENVTVTAIQQDESRYGARA